MNAYTPFPATRTHNGVSLPRLPWDADAPEPQAERKVTIMPATIFKTARPRLAEPKAEKTVFEILPGEDEQDAYLRGLLETQRQPIREIAAKSIHGKEAGKKGAAARKAAFDKKRADRDGAILKMISRRGATGAQIAEKFGHTRNWARPVMNRLISEGRVLKRFALDGQTYVYIAAMKESRE